jgi:LAS superfamily LD-carboxypeptidase LdcB
MTTLPISPVVLPSDLKGQENGKIDEKLLVLIDKSNGRLHHIAAKAFTLMYNAAKKDGIELKATSSADTYRTYEVQLRTFQNRYSRIPRLGQKPKVWNGTKYWLKKGFAGSAVPGTSNHGYGLAIDLVMHTGVLDWLLKNAATYGFTWEDQSENWHIRYILGDALPKTPAVKPAAAKPVADKTTAKKAAKPAKPTI